MSPLIRTLNRNFHRTLRILMIASVLASIIAGMIPPVAVRSLAPASLASVAKQVEALLPAATTAQAAAPTTAERSDELLESARPPAVALAAPAPVAHTANAPVPGANTGKIKGTVFRDFNSNGVMNTTGGATNPAIDTGVAGITVKAYDAAGAQVGATVTTAADGSYTISGVTDGTAYRVEFSTLPTGYESSFRNNGAGTTSGTSVQFVTGGTGNVSFGINQPVNYCQANPKVMTPRYKAGDISGASVGSAESSFTRDWNNTTTSSTSTMAQTGTTWGIAYDRDSQRVYSPAFLKRQSGLGSRGLDGIYVWNNTSGTPVLLGGFDLGGVTPSNGGAAIDLGSVTRSVVAGSGTSVNQLSSDPNLASRDDDAFGKVGKVGFGDADIGPDNKTLWTVNLNQRTLVAVDTSLVTPAATNPNLAPSAAVKQYNILAGGPAGATISGAPACTGGQLRPFGLGFSATTGYLGAVCDGSTSARYSANVVAYVLSFDPAAPTSFTTVASIPMNYTREASYYNFNGSTVTGTWQHWFDTYSAAETDGGFANFASAPQPMLSDIDIMNDGSLVLGFTDRWAHQQGWDNYLPGGTTLASAISTGDILRAYKSGATYTIEGPSNDNIGVSDYNALAGPGGMRTGFLLNDGPNGASGGEFFFGDEFTGSDATHGETSLGGIALLPGANEVLNTTLDPQNFNSMGLRWFSATTGNKTRAYERVASIGIADFGKGGGLGDVEVLCDTAPIEIGNRVWLDANHNGIQDPDEAPIQDVAVVLTDANGNSYTTLTGPNGEYYFNSGNIAGGVQSNTAYTLTIDSTQAALATYSLITPNVNSGTGLPDGVDSDASLVGTLATITLTTGAAGQNDHTLDFGFHPAALSLGNRLWFDTNNDGLDNDGASGSLGTGINGVTVQLLDHNNVITATTTTDPSGYYRFDNLKDGSTYTVVIAASNFSSGGRLAGYQNSTPTFITSADANDNGAVNGVLGGGGDVRSAAITLVEGALPLGETGIGGGTNAPDGDIHDNLTVDFGFYKLTLGNRVWLDANRDGLDGSETGAASIPVTLTTSAGVFVATTTTDASGYYTFTNLISGTYIVKLQAPTYYVSSSPDDATANTDLNDNGQGTSSGVISSQSFALTPGTASGDIAVNEPSGHTRNLTLDFGIYLPTADLQVLKSVEPPTYTLGVATQVTYTIIITNFGPSAVTNAVVTDTQPANVTFNNWTCAIQSTGSGSGVNACGAAGGNGDIQTTVSLRSGAAAVWTIQATISAAATGTIVNTASEALPPEITQDVVNRTDSTSAPVQPQQPLFSVGNRVWFDTNDDGATTGPGVAEPVPAVLMQLVDLSTNTVVQTINSGVNGYYRFDNVPAGDYEIVVAASNFQVGGILEGYRNSSGVYITTTLATYDNRDHGLNSFADTGVNGVHSVPFSLGLGLQPTGETAVGGGEDGPHGDANSNLTIDFGFNRQHTGNQLWYDTDNDGVYEPGAGELPVPAGVVVVMHAVVVGVDIGAVLTTTTDANGQYDFSAANNVNLDPTGIFIYVAIPPGQTALNSYVPSTPRQNGGGLDNNNTGALAASGVITSGLFYPLPASTANGAVVNDDTGETYQPTIDFGFVLETYSIGNRVWYDTDNDGQRDASEQPIAGVSMELLNSSGDVISTTVTDASGYYSFTNLLAGSYTVLVANENFATGGKLYGYQNSTATTPSSANVADDSRDHGINVAQPGVNGIRSSVVTVGNGLQPTGEADGVNGPEGDANDNLTIDFGFYKLALGNLVFDDEDNNGLYDPAIDATQGVNVRLFAADGVTEIPVGADGVLGTADDAPGGVTTAADGLYAFSGLTPGDYIVKAVTPTGHTSSTGSGNPVSAGAYEPAPDPDDNLDQDDNGTNGSGADAGLLVSLPVTLTPGDVGVANSNVINNATGSTTNPTVDFGSVHFMSLGNQVWDDMDNSGTINNAETSIDGVLVNLYYDANNDGDVDDAGETTPVSTTTTAGGGLYLFTNLISGNYVVELDANNFNTGNVLDNYTSSTGTIGSAMGPYETAPDPDLSSVDNDDNGSLNGVLGSGGSVRSAVFNLAEGSEPTNETPDNDAVTPDTNENLTIDFGVLRYASLGNYTWIDIDKDGVQDSGEPPLPGVTVQLLDATGAPIATTTTDASGLYTFTVLVADDYSLKFTPPAGYAITQQDQGGDDADSDMDPTTGQTIPTTVVLDERDRTWDAGFTISMSLGNLVWKDFNNNGVYEPLLGETGIPSVTVTLAYSGTTTAIMTTTTDINGTYLFTNLLPGGYIVTLPAVNFVSGAPLSGWASSADPVSAAAINNDTNNDDDGPGVASAAVSSQPSVLSPAGEPIDDGDTDSNSNLTVDFGFAPLLSLGNRVWKDNGAGGGVVNNGVQDGTEAGVANVLVNLLDASGNPASDANGNLVPAAVTDANGYYRFDKLLPDDYIVEIDESNFAFNAPLDTWVSSTGNSIGGSAPDVDSVPTDQDDNGNDAFVSGAIRSNPITLAYASEPLSESDLGLGDATVTPDGYHNLTVDFGFYQTVNLGNLVWADVDNEGDKDASEVGIDGVEVRLFKAGDDPLTATAVLTAVTSGGGFYNFDNLTPGQYFVYIPTPPAAYPVSSTPTDTADNGQDDDDNGSQNASGQPVRSPDLDLQAGQEPASITDTDGTSGDLTVDFGFFAPVTVGDTVWYDGDRDGEQDGGTETGVQDVKVTLFKADGSAATDITGALVATQLTDSTGQYFFSNLPPGDYYVQFDKTTLPAGYIFTTSNASGVADDVDSDADSDGKTGNTGYLPSGDSDITLDAGIFRAVVTVGDLVWYDNNRNGLYEPLLGEDGVPNVKVTLYNAATDAPQATYADGTAVTPATTDAAGLYLFADLPPGSYYVVFDLATLPAGYTVTTQDVGSNGFDPQDSDADPSTGKTSATPSLIDGRADLTLDMGIFNPVTVGDYVWYDNNRDGLQGSAVDEPGVAGVKVTLFKSDGTPVTQDAAGQPIAPLLTDSSGRYSFQNLLPDSYYVQFDLSTLPAGYLVTTPDVNGNSSNALDSDADATGKTAATASLKNGEADLTLDMGIYRPVSVGDYVWYDNDRDGLQDAGESGVAGVKATLFNADGTAAKDVAGSPVAAQTTDANGKYLFADLPPGSYYVQFDLTTLPVGYILTEPNAGDDAADSDADATGKTATTSLLKDGEQDLTLDLGVFQPASIGDYVWLDKDVDGVQDANELAVPGVQIALFKADGSPAIDVNGNPVAPQTTDATGKYQFINLPPGDYYVQFTPPANYFISTQDQGTDDNIDSDVDPTTGKTVVTTLVSGENDPSWDLGLYQGAAIGNYVWHDKNGNGLQEADESGLPDVTVTLYDSAGNPVATTQTDVHGYYGFSNLTPGDYSVQFATPAGYVATQSNQGDDDILDSDAIDGRTAVTTLINGEYDTTWDAGFTLPASIGRYVWDDGPKETANGIKDLNEPGVSGVIVILLDENDQEVARTITDSSGSFQFTNLAPGDYKLKFVTPSGAEFTQQVPGVDGSSDANPTTGETVVTTLTPGQLDLSWNVGIVKIPTALDTEFEPSGGNAQIYLPIIQNETQAPEERSSFKKPSIAPMPQTLDQIVVEYWYTFLRWWGYR